MKSNRNRVWISAWAVVVVMSGTQVKAEIPKQSKEDLHATASHALTGKVARTYERKERTDRFEYTYGVAEISVDSVEKGSQMAIGDRVFVRYWHKNFIGTGNPPPDHYGHWDVPSETDTVVVYVEGDRKTGFDVLSPNGFFKVSKGKARQAQADR